MEPAAMRKYSYDRGLFLTDGRRVANGMPDRYYPCIKAGPDNTFSVLAITFYSHRVYFV